MEGKKKRRLRSDLDDSSKGDENNESIKTFKNTYIGIFEQSLYIQIGTSLFKQHYIYIYIYDKRT